MKIFVYGFILLLYFALRISTSGFRLKRILRHLVLWTACRDTRGPGRQQGVRVLSARAPPEIAAV
jgi:hypothetical protein